MLERLLESAMKRIAVVLILTVTSSLLCSPGCRPARETGAPGPGTGKNRPHEAVSLRVDEAHDEVARFLSGESTSSPLLKPYEETAGWKEYASFIKTSCAEIESKRLKPMRDWAQGEFAEAIRNTSLLFYPFGGPDFLTAYQLFPTADTYVLLGLEFVGSLPLLEKQPPLQVEAYLDNFKLSLSDFLKKSYFITHDMNESLQPSKVHGILPLLCFFVKKADASVAGIKRLELDARGDLLEKPYEEAPKKARRPYGVKILFLPDGSRKVKSLYYFSCNLADSAFGSDSKLFLCLDRMMSRVTTFIKSASYLLHYREFTNIRNMILAKSASILEDDSGVPYRYFPPKDWQVELYGQYVKPVKDFTGVEQSDLKAAYSEPGRAKPLPFHLGYHWGSRRDALLFIKRKIPAPENP